jgi:hypothetical protein
VRAARRRLPKRQLWQEEAERMGRVLGFEEIDQTQVMIVGGICAAL